MYFESPGADIKELKARLREWHKKKLKLVVIKSVVFHVYRRSESDIEEDGHVVYYPKVDQQPSSATIPVEMSTKDLFNDNDEKPIALPADLLRDSIDRNLKLMET
jgi:hypothetical protein